MGLKSFLKRTLEILHIDATKNQRYDRMTRSIMQTRLRPDSVCIDIGCHKGEMLEIMEKLAPAASHYAFEPIPALFAQLQSRFGNKHHIYSVALSDHNGETTFEFVKNAPAYSGLKKRRYDVGQPEIEQIHVQVRTLDEIVPAHIQVAFMKIDVEGAELGVLKGAVKTIQRCKPLVVFEFGLGASDFYGTTADDIFDFFSNEAGMHIYTLKRFLEKKTPLLRAELETIYNGNTDYYFVAAGE